MAAVTVAAATRSRGHSWPTGSARASSAPASWAPCTPGPSAAAGGVVSRVVGSPRRSRPGRPPSGSAPSSPTETVEDVLAADDVDVVHVCTPERHPRARWSGPRSPPASTWSARSRWRSTADEAAELLELGRRRRRDGDGAVRLPLLPDRPRGAGARRRRARRARCACCTAPTCRTGWPGRPTTTGGSTPPPAGRRGRSPTSACTGATWSSSSPATASRGWPPGPWSRCPSRGGRPVETEDAAVRAVRDRPRRGRQRDDQPGQPGPQEPAVVLPRRRRARASASTRRTPRRCGSAAASGQPAAAARRGRLRRGGPLLRRARPGHPQGYQDCFDAFVADTYAALTGEAARRPAHLRRRPARRAADAGRPRLVPHGQPGWRSPREPRPRREPHRRQRGQHHEPSVPRPGRRRHRRQRPHRRRLRPHPQRAGARRRPSPPSRSGRCSPTRPACT